MTAVPGFSDYTIIILNIVSAILAAGLALLAGRRSDRPLVRSFVLVMWLEFAWAALYLVELFSPGLGDKIFWDALQYPVSLAAPLCLYLFARRATGRPEMDRRLSAVLFVPVAVTLLLVFIDPADGLLRASPFIDATVPFGELVYGFTVFDYGLFAYSYGLLFVSVFYLLLSYPADTGSERSRYEILLLGFLIPILGIIPSVLDVRFLGRRDNTPLLFALGNVLIGTGFFRLQLFDIIPIARKVLVDSLGDPVVVFDNDGLILDCNNAFAGLTDRGARSLRGRRLGEIFADWPEASIVWSERAGSSFVESESLTVSDERTGSTYRVSISSVSETVGGTENNIGSIALLRDITEIAAVEKQLVDWNSELEGRIAARLRDLELEIELRKAAEEGLKRVGRKMIESQHEILVTLSDVVENRSPETANHVLRVGEYARILATACGLSDESVALIVDAAPLHDVGKISIPDYILNKDGPLTDDEMAVMKTHTLVGYKLLGSSERSIIRAAAVIALNHHERWNGEGYPAGKAGKEIPLSGRIVCICDVYDALATTRSYKQPWGKNRILEFFSRESGKMFDPELVAILLSNAYAFHDVTARFPEQLS